MSNEYDLLVSPFDVGPDTVAPGVHSFSVVSTSFGTDDSRRVYGGGGAGLGEYYGGSRRTLTANLNFLAQETLLFENDYTRNRPRASELVGRVDLAKSGRETVVPIAPDVRRPLDCIMKCRPTVGVAPLFLQPSYPTAPITVHLAARWLREGEALAGLPRKDGGGWHAFRRMWVTERKGLPA